MAGGRSSSTVNRSVLRNRITLLGPKFFTVEAIVDHLQSTYRDYRGLKKLPFTSIVQQALDSLDDSQPKSKNSSQFTPSPSKKRQLEPSKAENADCGLPKRRKHERVDDLSSSSYSSYSNDGNASEDASSKKTIEEKNDLMKALLRSTYIESTKSKPKSTELEVAKEENKSDLGNEASVVNGASRSCLNWEERGPRFRDLGGMKGVVEDLKDTVLVPFYHPEVRRSLGIRRPVGGILLHGPPGCGKTTLARAIANEVGCPLYEICASNLVSGVTGASEENIRDLFSKAYRTAPSIVFIDEIDAIASKREDLRTGMEQRIVAQLMTCMDSYHKLTISVGATSQEDNSNIRPGSVLVIGATNRPHTIDSALRRPGRFDKEILIDVPDEKARIEIITALTRDLNLVSSVDILKIARATPGFAGVDLESLITEAANLVTKRVRRQRECELSINLVDEDLVEDLWKRTWSPKDLEKLVITMIDFEEGIKVVQPSTRREGFYAIPTVTWEDVGGLEQLRREFNRHLVRPLKYPRVCEEMGVNQGTGFLLYGPPGCGKTLIAQAVANEAGISFIYVKGPELLNKYVGETEHGIRTLFSRARTCSPCIIFFDEVDALTTRRDKEEGAVVGRSLNQLLIELDGIEQRQGIYVIGATNSLEVIDRAALRPGRFGNVLFVPAPGPNERGLVLEALARKMSVDPSVDLHAVGRMEACEDFTGADLADMMLKASMLALEEKYQSVGSDSNSEPCTIKMTHIEREVAKISPSVPKRLQKRFYTTFLKWKKGYC